MNKKRDGLVPIHPSFDHISGQHSPCELSFCGLYEILNVILQTYVFQMGIRLTQPSLVELGLGLSLPIKKGVGGKCPRYIV
jgi:hypothetical protein